MNLADLLATQAATLRAVAQRFAHHDQEPTETPSAFDDEEADTNAD